MSRKKRKSAAKKAPHHGHEQRLLFEELEPRVLLSANLEGLFIEEQLGNTVTVSTDLSGTELGKTPAEDGSGPVAMDLRRELIVVDTATPDYQTLIDGIQSDDQERQFQVVLISEDEDGIARLSEFLNGQSGIDAIHLISHGSAGAVQLGGTTLNFESLVSSSSAIKKWGTALDADADFLIYGCNLAADDVGQNLVDALARLTGADVAASDDLTGHVSLGGDWDLEYRVGGIATDIAFDLEAQQAWAALLATPVASDDAYATDQDTALQIPTASSWFDNAWDYRQLLTIDNSGRGQLDEVPILIKLDSSFDYANTKADGTDLRFVDSSGTSLAYEIESWDPSGDSYVWVKLDTLYAGNDPNNFIHVYYGNDAATDVEDAAAVWSNGYAGVWHLHDDLLDSTANGNDGTATDSLDAGGQIGDGQDFDGIDDYVDAGSNASIDNVFTGGGTVSAWILPEAWGENGYGRIADKSTTVWGDNGWGFQLNGNTDAIRFERGFSGSRGAWEAPGYISVDNPPSWQHVVVVYDDSDTANDPSFYVNGVLVPSFDVTEEAVGPAGSASSDAAQGLRIGNRAGATDRTFNGIIDEVRISSVARSADWISAQYAAESGSLVSLNAVEARPGVLVNDTDPDGDNLTLTSAIDQGGDAITIGSAFTTSTGALLTLNADGSFAFSPNGVYDYLASGATIAETFTYTASDANGGTDTATLTITINGLNDAPTGLTLSSTAVDENVGADTTVGTFSSTDPDVGDTFTYALVDGAGDTDNGAFTIVGNELRIIASPDFETKPSYDIRVRTTDQSGLSTEQTFTITVNDLNEAPTGTSNTVTTSANTPYTFSADDFGFTDVDAGDILLQVRIDTINLSHPQDSLQLSSVDVDPLDIIPVGQLGNLVFTPRNNGTGSPYVDFTFTVFDQFGAPDSTPRTMSIDVTPTNEAPSIAGTVTGQTVNDNAVISPFTGVTIGDTDKPDQILSVSVSLDTAAKGIFTATSLGASEFVDAGGGTYTYSGTAANATTAIQQLVFDPADNRVAPGETETATFTISIEDGIAATVTDSTTTVISTSVNDAPVAFDDSGTAVEAGIATGSDAIGNVLTNDTDVDSGDSKTVTYVRTGTEAAGSGTPGTIGSGLAGTYGTLILNSDGSYSYVVDDANPLVQEMDPGDLLTDTFTYTMEDGLGAAESAELVVTIEGTDDAPLVSGTFTGAVTEGDPGDTVTASGTIAISDVDADDSPSFADTTVGGFYGSLTLVGGTWTYTLDQSTVQDLDALDTVTDTITLTASDGTTRDIVITITGANDALAAADDSYTIDEDSNLQSHNGWWDDSWDYRQRLNLDNTGRAQLDQVPILIELDASFDYTNAKADGTDLRFVDSSGTLLAYQIESWNPGGNSYVWVKLDTLYAGNDPDNHLDVYYGNAAAADDQNPMIVWSNNYGGVWQLNGDVSDSTGNNTSTDYGTSTAGTSPLGGGSHFDGNDWVDTGSTQLQTAENFTIGLWFNADDTATVPQHLLWQGSSEGNGFGDGGNQTDFSDHHEMHISLGNYQGGGWVPNVLTFHFGNTDLDQDPDDILNISTAITGLAGGWHQVTVVVENMSTTPTATMYLDGALVGTDTGSLARTDRSTWDPSLQFGKPGLNQRYFSGQLDQVTISTTARSADWVAAQYAADSGSLITYNAAEARSGVLDNDTDPDGDKLTVTAVQGDGGNVGLATATDQGGSVTLNDDGSFIYTPLADFAGIDTFTYEVSNGKGDTAEATVTITVNAINDEPSFTHGGNQTVDEDSGTNAINIFASASAGGGADEASQTFTYAVSNDNNAMFSVQPAIDTSGDLTYTLAPDANGTATVTVSVTDSGGTANGGDDTSPTQAFTITVNQINDPASFAGDISGSGPEDGGAITGTLTVSDAADGISAPNFRIEAGDEAANGTASIDAAGAWSYTPNANFNGTDSFTVSVTDDDGNVETQVITATVTPVNDPPALGADSVVITEDVLATIAASDLLANDSDPEGDALSIVAITQPVNGTLTDNGDGTFTYEPNPNFFGADSFSYTVSDGNGNTATAAVAVTVDPVDDAPIVDDANFSVDAGAAAGTVVGNVTASDADPSDTLTYAIVGGNAGGAFSIDPSTGWVTVNDPDLLLSNGAAGFTLTVAATDSSAAGLVGTATITVLPTNIPLDESTGDLQPLDRVMVPDPANDPTTESGGNPDETIEEKLASNEEPENSGGTNRDDPLSEPPPAVQVVEPLERPKPPEATPPRFEIPVPLPIVDTNAISMRTEGEQRSPEERASGWVQNNQKLFAQLDKIKFEMDNDESWENSPETQLAMRVTTGMTISFSAGFLAWLLRGGSLLASFLTSMPMWARFDPLPVLAVRKKRAEDKRKDASEEAMTEHSDETIFGIRDVLDEAERTSITKRSDDTTHQTQDRNDSE